MSGMNPIKAIETLEKYRDLLPLDAQEAVDCAEYCLRRQWTEDDEAPAVEEGTYLFGDMPLSEIVTVKPPKVIARISFCGSLTFEITDLATDFKAPTPEQIKNLKEMLCIDVELLEDEQ